MRRLRRAVVACLFAVAVSSSAFAQPPNVVHQQRLHRISFTFSPLHLILPIVEVTGEARLQPKLGVAGIVGVGSVGGFLAFELGAQGRYYLFGDFDNGMQIGGEVLYVNVSTTSGSIAATGNGLAVGPFIGYKFSASFGLTFDAQLGIEYDISLASASSGSTTTSAAQGGFIPLLNLNVGWAF